jgi:hypothetical protein
MNSCASRHCLLTALGLVSTSLAYRACHHRRLRTARCSAAQAFTSRIPSAGCARVDAASAVPWLDFENTNDAASMKIGPT